MQWLYHLGHSDSKNFLVDLLVVVQMVNAFNIDVNPAAF